MNNKQIKNKKAFSLIELSIVLLVVGIIIAGITQSSRMIGAMRLSGARGITQSSPVATIPNLILWLEPTGERSFGDVNSGYTLNNGDSIQTWYDTNPQVSEIDRRHFAAPASNKRPTYVATGIGNLPSIQITRSFTRYFENTRGILDLSDASYTIFSVAKMTSYGGSYYFVFGQAAASFGSAGQLASIVYSGVNGALGLATGGNDYYPSSIVNNRVNITAATLNGTAAAVYNNSFTANSATLAGSAAGGVQGLVSRIGVAPYNETELFEGLISEVIVYSRVLRTEEIQAIMTYLSKKYSVRLT